MRAWLAIAIAARVANADGPAQQLSAGVQRGSRRPARTAMRARLAIAIAARVDGAAQRLSAGAHGGSPPPASRSPLMRAWLVTHADGAAQRLSAGAHGGSASRSPLMRAWLAIAIAARVAHADGAAQELSAGANVASAGPRTNWVADRMTGIWDASEHWQVRADVTATRAFAATIAAPASDVMSAALAAELDPDAHWSVRGNVGWSPEVTSLTGATVEAEGLPSGAGDVVVQATSAMTSAALALGYDTAGTSDFETSVGVTLGGSYVSSRQDITSVVDAGGEMLTVQQLAGRCGATSCSPELRAALSPQWTQLVQFIADVNVNETVQQDTDVGIDASHFTYSADPTRVGYFALTTVGRGNLGAGVAVAPLDYTVAPSVSHRFDALAVTANLSYGSYIHDLGYDVSAALRVQYKVVLDDGKRLKLHAKVSGSWDVTDALSAAVTFAAGAQYSW